jgi:CRP-like cAMP-binding protein
MATREQVTITDPFERFSPEVEEAWAESFMAEFDRATISSLLESATEVSIGAGETFYYGAHHADMATLALVLDGLLRTVVCGSEGREVTIRYADQGAVVGLPAVLVGGTSTGNELTLEQWLQVGGASITGEAIRDSRVLRLSPARFRQLAQREASVAWPLARYLAQQSTTIQQLLAAGIFLPVRARVARHILDLAELEGGSFVVHASHQEIAGATGTVREVVSRVLRAFGGEGLAERREGVLVLLDRDRLHEISNGQ